MKLIRNKLKFQLALFVCIVLSAASYISYNEILKSQAALFNAWSDLDAMFQERVDLVAKLSNAVVGDIEYESPTIKAVAAAKNKIATVHLDLAQLSDAQQVQAYASAQQELQISATQLIAEAKQIHILQSQQAFQELLLQWQIMDKRISYAQQRVNAITERFNQEISSFPGIIVNLLFLHLEKKVSFE